MRLAWCLLIGLLVRLAAGLLLLAALRAELSVAFQGGAALSARCGRRRDHYRGAEPPGDNGLPGRLGGAGAGGGDLPHLRQRRLHYSLHAIRVIVRHLTLVSHVLL